MWNKFWNWFCRNPINRFWFSMSIVVLVFTIPVVTWTKPQTLTWIAALFNLLIALGHLYEWAKLKRGPKS